MLMGTIDNNIEIKIPSKSPSPNNAKINSQLFQKY